jgi:tripartite ATP-independent transporter DctP family solute receptor
MTKTKLSRRHILQAAAALPIGGTLVSGFPHIARAAAPIALRLATSFNTDPTLSPAKVFYDKLVEGLKKNCGDAISVDIYPDAQLGGPADLIPQLKFGTVDIMMEGSAIFATVVPEVGVFDLGYVFQNFDHFHRTLDGSVGKTVNAMMEDKAGVIILGWSQSFGARNVLTKTLVKIPEDLAGMKVRSLPSPPVVDTVRAMGALPTPMPIQEAYVSLQTGLVQGIEHDPPTMLAAKFFEAAKFLLLTQHTFQAIPPIMSKRSFGRIPANLQEGFLAAATAAVAHERDVALVAEANAIKELKERGGVTVTDCDRSLFEARCRPLWTDYGAKYPKAKELLDGMMKDRA